MIVKVKFVTRKDAHPLSLETEIKAYAHKIGFDVVAIGPAEPYIEAEQTLRERRAKGHYPAFTEPDIALRCDPEKMLPSAKTVIALGVSYLTDDRSRATRAGDDPKGQMSRYAWGHDYHPIMRERMQRLIEFMEARVAEQPGAVPVEAQAYVDTGPPLDREVAEKAGLGWFGKNTLLYVPDYGSWVFLGQIFTNVKLTPDPRVTLDCGDCDLCMRACPTGAIIEPFYVEPNLCISHLTQMGGSIPAELRERIGLRVWGCDVCQQVCPWNDEAQVANRPEFRPVDDLDPPAPSLIDMLEMTTGQFRRRFGPTAAAWRGKRTLQRNAAIALGNTRNEAVVPALAKALTHDRKPVVRGSAAWALGRIGTDAAATALSEALAHETDADVLDEIEQALGRIASPTPEATPEQ